MGLFRLSIPRCTHLAYVYKHSLELHSELGSIQKPIPFISERIDSSYFCIEGSIRKGQRPPPLPYTNYKWATGSQLFQGHHHVGFPTLGLFPTPGMRVIYCRCPALAVFHVTHLYLIKHGHVARVLDTWVLGARSSKGWRFRTTGSEGFLFRPVF